MLLACEDRPEMTAPVDGGVAHRNVLQYSGTWTDTLAKMPAQQSNIAGAWIANVYYQYGSASPVRYKYSLATNSWSADPSTLFLTRNTVHAYLGKLYSFGGMFPFAPIVFDLVQRLDPRAPAPAAALAPMPAGRADHVSAIIGNLVYIIGGIDAAGAAQSTVFEYNISTDTWRTLAPLPFVI